MRIFAVSDLHTDFPANRDIVDGISRQDHTSDALIVAGDLSHLPEVFEDTLETLKDRFGDVFFVPGNHDLWVRANEEDSVARFRRLLALCDSMGVRTRPALSITSSRAWESSTSRCRMPRGTTR